jgi:hypothetical protein
MGPLGQLLSKNLHQEVSELNNFLFSFRYQKGEQKSIKLILFGENTHYCINYFLYLIIL